MPSDKVDINGWSIWYEKHGSGDVPLLLIPGPLGTAKTDFFEQLYGENELDKSKFTIICVELPGWGRSRPPQRLQNDKTLKNDAECCASLMKKLGYTKFSALGLSFGAKVAIILAIEYPTAVEKLILVSSTVVYPTESAISDILMKQVRGNDKFPLDNYLRGYSHRKLIIELWNQYISFVQNNQNDFEVVADKLTSIKCPTLILHGDKDQIALPDQNLNVLKNINNAKVKRFESAGHHLHKDCSDQFKQTVESFLVS